EVGSGRIFSPALGLELRVEGNQLRLYDPSTGQRLLTPDEENDERKRAEARAEQAAARAEQEAARAEQEAARARRLEAEVERLRRRLDDR
ncbi:MAG: Uma2 family endonuclease, partial [Candidatus Xenobia bacterium]